MPADHRISPAELAALRRARGLTQEQLAQEIGKGTSTIYKWENGIKEPPKWLRRWLLGYDQDVSRATEGENHDRTAG